MFHWDHWGFRLETGYDLHTFFQNLRNNEKKRKAIIVSGSKRKIPRVFRHWNIKVNGLTTSIGATANSLTGLVLIKEICKIRLFFNGEYYSFLLKIGEPSEHTIFLVFRNYVWDGGIPEDSIITQVFLFINPSWTVYHNYVNKEIAVIVSIYSCAFEVKNVI